jgi:hypothetical protein
LAYARVRACVIAKADVKAGYSSGPAVLGAGAAAEDDEDEEEEEEDEDEDDEDLDAAALSCFFIGFGVVLSFLGAFLASSAGGCFLDFLLGFGSGASTSGGMEA